MLCCSRGDCHCCRIVLAEIISLRRKTARSVRAQNMAIDPTATIGATPMLTVQPSRENEINSIIEIMHSRVLIEKVVDAIGPEVLMESGDHRPCWPTMARRRIGAMVRAAAIRMLSKSLNVEAAKIGCGADFLRCRQSGAGPKCRQPND